MNVSAWSIRNPVPGLMTFVLLSFAGTLAAILIYFFRDWLLVLAHGFGIRMEGDPDLTRNRSLLWFMVAATIPVGLFGYIFKEQAETTWRSPNVIGAMMIGVGVILWLAERAGRRHKDLSHLNFTDAMAIGFAQVLAIVPGTSRSGITIAIHEIQVPKNKPELLKAADPDGSTMLLTPAAMVTLYPHIYRQVTYKPQDVAPVTGHVPDPAREPDPGKRAALGAQRFARGSIQRGRSNVVRLAIVWVLGCFSADRRKPVARDQP